MERNGQLEVEIIQARGLIMKPGSKGPPGDSSSDRAWRTERWVWQNHYICLARGQNWLEMFIDWFSNTQVSLRSKLWLFSYLSIHYPEVCVCWKKEGKLKSLNWWLGSLKWFSVSSRFQGCSLNYYIFCFLPPFQRPILKCIFWKMASALPKRRQSLFGNR